MAVRSGRYHDEAGFGARDTATTCSAGTAHRGLGECRRYPFSARSACLYVDYKFTLGLWIGLSRPKRITSINHRERRERRDDVLATAWYGLMQLQFDLATKSRCRSRRTRRHDGHDGHVETATDRRRDAFSGHRASRGWISEAARATKAYPHVSSALVARAAPLILTPASPACPLAVAAKQPEPPAFSALSVVIL